jgi:hypothetical protein
MQEPRPILPRLLIMAILLAAMCVVLLLAGTGLLVMLISISGLGFLLWWFTRKEPPQGDMPCASVSCCHYLEDREEEEQKR